MFDLSEMKRIVTLQGKSYEMFRWMANTLDRSNPDFRIHHEAMSLSEAAQDWLRRNVNSLPKELRVEDADLSAFASLLSSYLTTSFNFLPTPVERYRSQTGCTCLFCTQLRSVSILKVRQPSKKAQDGAQEMKQLYLFNLGREFGLTLPYSEINLLLTDTKLASAISYATYGCELLRRSQFASQGEGILVLWREIAWENGKLRKNFVLSAEAIVAAENQIIGNLLI